MSQSRRKAPEPQLGPLGEIIGYHFRRTWNVLRKDFEASVQDLGVRQTQIGILSVIQATPGINQGIAGKILDIQRANMVALIGELVAVGWVVRREDPSDRRAIALTLTSTGEKMLAKALRRIERHEQNLFSVLSESERKKLVEMLKRISDARIDGAN